MGLSAELGSATVRERLASRYDVDLRAFHLGKGRALFERARAALFTWRHFQVPWVEFHHAGPAALGQSVASVVSFAGVWFLNPCRVVYIEPEREDVVAFAYGTLRGHVESGEERFEVSFERATQDVVYRLCAFSRPALLATKLGYPFARRVQARFAADSARVLAEAAA